MMVSQVFVRRQGCGSKVLQTMTSEKRFARGLGLFHGPSSNPGNAIVVSGSNSIISHTVWLWLFQSTPQADAKNKLWRPWPVVLPVSGMGP